MNRTGSLKKEWNIPADGVIRVENNDPAIIADLHDLFALAQLRDLARRFVAVEVTIADCGCHAVSLFANGEKILEEDKSLAVAVANVMERIGVANEKAE